MVKLSVNKHVIKLWSHYDKHLEYEKITINADYVKKNLGQLVKDTDLSKFIL